MTHRMQELAPTEYRAFRDIVAGEETDSIQARMAAYSAKGVKLTYEQAIDEVAADYAGRLIDDGKVLDEFIRQHRENRTLLQKVRDAIRSLMAKLTGAEKKKAQSAEGKLTAALKAAAKQAETLETKRGTNKNTAQKGGERYSIKKTTGNKPFVEVEQDILEGVPESEWISVVKENLRKKVSQRYYCRKQ